MNNYQISIGLSDQKILNSMCFIFFKEETELIINGIMKDCHKSIAQTYFDSGITPTIKIKEIKNDQVILNVFSQSSDTNMQTIIKEIGDIIYKLAKNINDSYNKIITKHKNKEKEN